MAVEFYCNEEAEIQFDEYELVSGITSFEGGGVGFLLFFKKDDIFDENGNKKKIDDDIVNLAEVRMAFCSPERTNVFLTVHEDPPLG